MAADKPLQDIYNTVRISLTDAIVSVDTQDQYRGGAMSIGGYGSDYGMYWNCYPQFFTDRSQNQYSSQFDTWVTKRGPVTPANSIANIANGILATASVTEATNNICITQLDDIFICSVWDSTAGNHKIIQYRPQANTQLVIGTLAAGTPVGYVPAVGDLVYLSEITVANTPVLAITMVSADEQFSRGAYITSVAGTFPAALTPIADANFPANLANTIIRGPIVQMDSYAFVMTKLGSIYNSNLNTIATWTSSGSASLVQAIQSPDQGIGLVRYKHLLVAMGEDSIEFFQNNANPPPKSPLGRTDQAFIKFGCVGAKSIVTVEDTVFWWAKSSAGKYGLYKLDGYTPVKVSSLREDLLAARQPLPPELYVFMDRGKQHIISTIQVSPNLLYNGLSTLNTAASGFGFVVGTPQGSVSGDPFSLIQADFTIGYVCWDIQTGVWWVHSNTANIGAFPLVAQSFANSILSVYPGPTTQTVMFSNGPPHQSNGLAGMGNQIHSMWSGGTGTAKYVYSDGVFANPSTATTPITAGIQFNVWDFGNEKRKRIHKFKIIQRQYGINTQSLLTPYTWVIANKSDGDLDDQTASQLAITRIWRRVVIQNPSISRSYVNNMGSARKWYFGIIQKSDNAWSVKAVELNITQMDN